MLPPVVFYNRDVIHCGRLIIKIDCELDETFKLTTASGHKIHYVVRLISRNGTENSYQQIYYTHKRKGEL